MLLPSNTFGRLWDKMRATCVNMVHELARKDDRIAFIGSDLSPGLLDDMKKEMPDRHFMEGIAEAHVVGMAAGMAMEGFTPFVNTIATFITRRCYEQVALDICLHDLPVRLIGNGGGLVYAPLGPTHLAIEDVALMSALPNMTVVACSDKEEMRKFMACTPTWQHPIYIRLGKGGDPVISRPDEMFEIGRAVLKQGPDKAAKADVTVISTGVMTARCMEAADILENSGISCRVVHFATVKPLDTDMLEAVAKNSGLLVSVEEHVLSGGLGASALHFLAGRGKLPGTAFLQIAIPDAFAHNYGVQDDLIAYYGLDPDSIAAKINECLADSERKSN